jgi:hypothetical protein
MLHGICDKKGIIPETLPGYDRRRSPSPSSHSPTSTRVPLERLQISDVASEPPRMAGTYLYSCFTCCIVRLTHSKLGEAPRPPEDVPVVAQAPPTHVGHPWAEFKVDKHFFLK